MSVFQTWLFVNGYGRVDGCWRWLLAVAMPLQRINVSTHQRINVSTHQPILHATLHTKACRNGCQDSYHYAEHSAPDAFFLFVTHNRIGKIKSWFTFFFLVARSKKVTKKKNHRRVSPSGTFAFYSFHNFAIFGSSTRPQMLPSSA